ncbi:hypothetical protein CZ774_01260 [Frigoribacterium sp. JB110]|uniref:Ribonuclease HIII n=1 Tax=Microbacterium amylolyticum TaxID=936337 RepID=A0ABS4ZIN0_9MICO|nr:ribonuclease HIII [Microbacterium amylolyticum]SJM44631.1 hypothetical protein CZ774_01260 [Frigoribacterium sp. JB110]
MKQRKNPLSTPVIFITAATIALIVVAIASYLAIGAMFQ